MVRVMITSLDGELLEHVKVATMENRPVGNDTELASQIIDTISFKFELMDDVDSY